MSTWNVITIAEAPRLTEKKLRKAIERAGLDLDEQTVDQLADEWKVYGHSKYGAEGLAELAEDITRRHPGSRAEVFQEWDTRDADEPGQSLDVYRVTASTCLSVLRCPVWCPSISPRASPPCVRRSTAQAP